MVLFHAADPAQCRMPLRSLNKFTLILSIHSCIKVLRREGCLKDEYGSNVPVHLLLPPVGPNQVGRGQRVYVRCTRGGISQVGWEPWFI